MSVLGPWSHVGAYFYAGDEVGYVCSEAYPTVIDFDVLRKDYHKGVQTVDLLTRLQTYPSHRVAVRTLNNRRYTKADWEQFRRNVNAFVDRFKSWDAKDVPQYHRYYHIKDFIQYGTHTDNDYNTYRDIYGKSTKYYVCTAWTAEVLMHLGVIEPDSNEPGNHTLADFGFPWNVQLATFCKDWEMGSLVYITPEE